MFGPLSFSAHNLLVQYGNGVVSENKFNSFMLQIIIEKTWIVSWSRAIKIKESKLRMFPNLTRSKLGLKHPATGARKIQIRVVNKEFQ